ncbi:MAG: hypothetical protein JWM78_2094 [Verrucomicrobiaceae bacterium]|nr:hypothetical protein [Verrucomicrobiaceae bacterium]
MTLSRREFLQRSAITSLALGVPTLGLRTLAFAADGAEPMILVVVHLRGGCDGFNLISPANDATFIAARNADLRVDADGGNAGFHLDNGLDPALDFRLHAAAKGLADIYTQGQLAFVHAVGLTNETRSHFVATDMIERGVATQTAFARTDSGWLARYLEQRPAVATTGAISVANAVSGELTNYSAALAVPTLDYGFSVPGGPVVANLLDDLYRPATGAVGDWGRRTLAAIQTIDQRVRRDAQGKIIAYKPSGDSNYEAGAELGRGLKNAAQLIKMDIGLTAVSVELGGWDTHENQPGRFKNLVEKLSSGLSAFWNDTAAYHSRMVVITTTEFGRRLRSNRSNGTDHGRAGVMAILGGNVAGGRMFGTWPGLGQKQLDEGVDLAVTTDYRQVIAEVLAAHSGDNNSPTAAKNPLTKIFPEFEAASPLGLFARVPAAT